MKQKYMRGEMLLFITAIIWGISFVAQKLGMNNLTNTKRDEVATAADTVLQGRTVTAGFAYQL